MSGAVNRHGRFLDPGTRVRRQVKAENGPRWEYGIVAHCWLENIAGHDVWRCYCAFFGMDFPKESQRNGQISGNALSTH
jgi:hypothetical protein